MIREPPIAVPDAMVKAQTTLIHACTLNSGARRKSSQGGRCSKALVLVVAVKRVNAMMPMVFCASLVPWVKLIQDALSNWQRPNTTFVRCGLQFRSRTMSNAMNAKPTTMPQAGDKNIGPTTLGQSPSVLCVAGLKTDHLITDQSLAAEAKVAPQSPPISAWLELDGRHSHHVNRFQAIAASNAASSVVPETKWVSTRPWPMVAATAVPLSAPNKLKRVVRTMAWRGVRTLVETVVAMALA